MIETFAALLFAHALADFILQTAYIAQNKRRPLILLLHGAIVLATAQAATGRVDAWPLLALSLAHIAIDAAKSAAGAAGLPAFLADQGAHLASLAVVAWFWPGLFAGGVWAETPALATAMAGAAGAILAIRAGGFAVGKLMRAYQEAAPPEGLPSGGRMIGMLERAMIFLLVLVGQPEGVGFLIAAKSILRFDSASKNQHASEYVIIGTLASYGWAMFFSYATLWLMAALPPLEIGAQLP
ncbi:MAG: DUF3307 domain-containing protein [Paracoccaceae bacterium]